MPAEAHAPAPWRHPVFHEMRQRIEELEEENRQLRDALVPVAWLPRAWRLSPAETRLVVALAQAEGPLTHNRARLAAGSIDRTPSEETMEVHVSRARTKLRPLGIQIINVRAVGLVISAEGRAIVRQGIEAVASGRLT
ncbi:helix-turn-helix domain-containing protein [Methylobacterium sp. Leaf85]|uniref:helix-turn-helix domain-containing protein n=1 Tax=Methylobacterium sp. Leaf85 TaxID=1736241 RepID=UPI0006FDD4AF|nr:helix-turn-helix domain-containing protein [Methylobacterium sp. Leaf85]KQO53094.1 hypothetical protein ASF08_19410 [Methylobacterium sp. Leaf85]